MTALAESTKRKLSLLQLAEELNNVGKACQIMGYHRDTFYEVRRAIQVGGVGALVAQRSGPRQPHPNRVLPEVEERILAFCLVRPTSGAARVANELRLSGLGRGLISPDPEPDRCEGNGGKEVARELVVARGDPSDVLELVEEALDEIALPVEPWIDGPDLADVALARDVGGGAVGREQ
jgi:hypothetical protein